MLTQATSSRVAPRLPAICGSATLTMVVSSTSMIAAVISPNRMNQRPAIAGASVPAGALRDGGAHRRYTVAVTDMPGRSTAPASAPPSRTIFTGTRCTTLTKLPLALSAGSRLNVAPVAPAIDSTWPL